MGRNSLLAMVAVLILATTRQGGAAGDPQAGAQAFRACAACHTLEPGVHRTGPSLAGVFGRKAGTAEGFHRYSGALRSADLVWSEDTLTRFLADPQAFLPGNRMTFSGIADAQARADVIAYLQTASAAGAGAEPAERSGMMANPQLIDLRRETGPNNRITLDPVLRRHLYGRRRKRRIPPVLGVQPSLQDQFQRQRPGARASRPDPGQHDGRSGVCDLRGARGNQPLHRVEMLNDGKENLMRNLLALMILMVALGSGPAKAEEPYAATLYKNPQCGCCEGYADYLRENGFEVTVKPTHDLPLLHRQYGVPGPARGLPHDA